ncbi:hypothetical protein ARMSODRAFT_966715 [Armillaria solidipes]|uniref:Uncharacterized protein n=1 Tax=Armillaria solidipes TaxID=1076256 RepID=A0A2H3ALM1_9AGAR|nr:hypothetical protein ARMSODRAFT_966715 [Armillaria solidipes]
MDPTVEPHLAIERFRWRELGRPRLERHSRKCQNCGGVTRTCHVRMQRVTTVVIRDEPDLALVYGQLDDIDFLKKLVQSRKAITTVAKWAYAVLRIFYAVPVYRGGG